MDRTRELRRGRLALRAALAAVKLGVLGLLLAWPAVGALQSAGPGATDASGCAPEALDRDRPAQALIRTDEGRVQQVSFDVAWDVYKGRRPGTVLAVCVDEGSR